MSFRSVHHILGSLENQEGWQGRKQFQQLIACWAQLVGTAVAAQTRPVYIQRHVLQVATASSVWAQNLTFERRRILEKINAQIPLGLTDIRFSTAQWQSQTDRALEDVAAELLWREHPSRVRSGSNPTQTPARPAVSSPDSAFQHWAAVVRQRSQHLPLCPNCQCPTPAGELERWSVCSLCVAQRW
jgi:predicted nucleic acid-binding Zn ribbon protein